MIIVDPVVFRLPLDCKRAEVWLRHTGDYIVYDYEALHCDDKLLAAAPSSCQNVSFHFLRLLSPFKLQK